MALLREYHAAIGEIIFKHGGTLERFVGDGVMVIFNDPIPLQTHRCMLCRWPWKCATVSASWWKLGVASAMRSASESGSRMAMRR